MRLSPWCLVKINQRLLYNIEKSWNFLLFEKNIEFCRLNFDIGQVLYIFDITRGLKAWNYSSWGLFLRSIRNEKYFSDDKLMFCVLQLMGQWHITEVSLTMLCLSRWVSPAQLTTRTNIVRHNGYIFQDSASSHRFSPEVEMALKGVQFIAQHIRNNDKDNEVMEDWKYIAMVLDRLFLWLFTMTCFLGSGGIILRAPSLYDMREPIDAKYTTIGVWMVGEL